jgi:hypothetical protein
MSHHGVFDMLRTLSNSDDLLKCGIVHKSKKYLFVLVHALDKELLQQILEHQLEFVARINCGLPQTGIVRSSAPQ